MSVMREFFVCVVRFSTLAVVAARAIAALAVVAVMCVWLGGCRYPGETPPPPPDWSDPERQGKVELLVRSCTRVQPSWQFGRWELHLKIEVIGNSQKLAFDVGENLKFAFDFDSRKYVSMVGANGTRISVAGRPWPFGRDPWGGGCYFGPKIDVVKQLSTGEWTYIVGAMILCNEKPTGLVVVRFDAEVTRLAISSKYDDTKRIPLGGLTIPPAELEMPAASPPPPPPPWE